MTVIVLIFIALLLVTCRPTKENEKYLDKNYTNIIKGFFLLFVFFAHSTQYKLQFSTNWYDSIGLKIHSILGQLIVTMFLFYSGYGIMESIKTKDSQYIENMPKKRILTTWLHFAFAVCIYCLVTQYFKTNEFSIKKIVLALVGWDSFGNSNWYIFCIIIMYAITYLSAKSFKDNKKILISVFIGTLLYTTVMSFYKSRYWYNTAFCYVFGIAYSMYKKQIEDFIKGRELLFIIYSIVAFIIAFKLKKYHFWCQIHAIFFVFIIILLTRKISIKNVIFQWLGKNLFPLYIFQRLPMRLLNENNYMHNNPYILFITAFGITIIITLVYNFLIFLSNKVKNKITIIKEKVANE